MSGNGASSNQASAPWAAASPYIQSILQNASGLYSQQAPNFNAAPGFGYGSVTGGVNNAITGNTQLGAIATGTGAQTTAALNNALSGTPDYTATGKAIGAANQQQWDDFYNNVVPTLNSRASFLGNPSGAIKDMNSSVSNITRNQGLNADQAYLSTYNQAQDRALQAAGLGSSIAGQVGSQSLQGASLYPTISQLPNTALTDYASTVGGLTSPYGTKTQSISPGSGAGFMNVLGSGLGLADLAGKLFGTSGGSQGLGTQAYNGIKNWLGGGAAAGGDLAGIGGTGAGAGITGIGNAGAADIAAAGAQPIGAGLGAGASDAAGAGALAGGGDAAGGGAGALAAGGGGVGGGGGAGGLGGAAAGAQSGADAGATAAGAGSLGLGLAGAAVPVAAAAFGASRQPYDLKASYWKNVTDSLTKGQGNNATYNATVPPEAQKYAAKMDLYQQLTQHGTGNLTSSDFGKGGNAIPANVLALAKQYGMINADGSVNKSWSTPAPTKWTNYGRGGPGGRAY